VDDLSGVRSPGELLDAVSAFATTRPDHAMLVVTAAQTDHPRMA
jgi:hypothetical protein